MFFSKKLKTLFKHGRVLSYFSTLSPSPAFRRFVRAAIVSAVNNSVQMYAHCYCFSSASAVDCYCFRSGVSSVAQRRCLRTALVLAV